VAHAPPVPRARTVTTTIHIDSPIGSLRLSAGADALTAIAFVRDPASVRTDGDPPRPTAVLEQAAVELAEYFAGRRRAFTVPLDPRGTPFQQRVWRELLAIPYGSTVSYSELARRLGAPNATRAVGAANGANPLPIVVPCHRVIAADGTLCGFGGGLPIKRFLLELEGGGAQGRLAL
jgi:methylated-DNA-[protein]-cysteine S-methyltransferase